MATIKSGSGSRNVSSILDYVMKSEKTEQKLMTGINCSPETVKNEMQMTKELWGKTEGRTYKHYIQSFAPEENITPLEAHRIACELVEKVEAWKGHEVLIATHKDKEHVHTHFIVNSVNIENGRKLQWSKKDLAEMKKDNDRICKEHGFHVPEKGKTFSGEVRTNITAFEKDTYQTFKQAEETKAEPEKKARKVESYVIDIRDAIAECRKNATSQTEFKELMKKKNIEIDWQDNHKYIVFIDLARLNRGEKKCKVRHNKLEQYFNQDFNKESLQSDFDKNLQTKIEENKKKQVVEIVEKMTKARLDYEKALEHYESFGREVELNYRPCQYLNVAKMIQKAKKSLDEKNVQIEKLEKKIDSIGFWDSLFSPEKKNLQKELEQEINNRMDIKRELQGYGVKSLDSINEIIEENIRKHNKEMQKVKISNAKANAYEVVESTRSVFLKLARNVPENLKEAVRAEIERLKGTFRNPDTKLREIWNKRYFSMDAEFESILKSSQKEALRTRGIEESKQESQKGKQMSWKETKEQIEKNKAQSMDKWQEDIAKEKAEDAQNQSQKPLEYSKTKQRKKELSL